MGNTYRPTPRSSGHHELALGRNGRARERPSQYHSALGTTLLRPAARRRPVSDLDANEYGEASAPRPVAQPAPPHAPGRQRQRQRQRSAVSQALRGFLIAVVLGVILVVALMAVTGSLVIT